MKNTESLYRLEVAPLVILPLNRAPFFTYASKASIALGSLVSISFGKQTIEGVVFDCQPLPGSKPHWIKEVSKVIMPAFLTENQLALAEKVSEEYFTPLGKTLKHFLPKVSATREKKTSDKPTLKTLKPDKTELMFLKKLSSKSRVPFYLDTSSLSLTDPKRTLTLLAKQTAKEKKQTLIIVPEITLIPALTIYLESYFKPEHLAILHSKLSHGAYYAAWERIRTGEASVIVATRQGLFAPFHDLGAVIVTEEQDESYKQWDMSPRYHGKRVASFLAELWNATLILSSGTPGADSLLAIREKHMKPLIAMPTHPALGSSITVINLKLERYRKNYSPLSEELWLRLDEALTRGEQALLYINRQGMNAFSVCDHCKEVFRCKECEHPLTGTKEGDYRCLSCGYRSPAFPSCPSCGHLSFRHVGFGTEKVEREVAKRFPKARVMRLDASTQKSASGINTVVENGLRNEIDILIGTQMILKDPPLPKLSLIAMIDADSLLLFPDFQADERLYRDISRAVRQVAEKEGGNVLIQTFRPENAFFQKTQNLTGKEMAEKILSEREELSYPPYSRFLSLTCQGTEKEATTKAKTLHSTISASLPPEYRLFPPRQTHFLKKKARFESVILLRIPNDKEIPDSLKSLLKRVNKDCIIDIDPISL